MNLLLIDAIDFPFGGAQSVYVGLVVKGLRENGENAFLIIPYGNKGGPLHSNKKKYGHFDGCPYYFVTNYDGFKKINSLLDVIIGVFNTAGLIYKRKRKKKVDAVVLGSTPDIIRHSPIIIICLLFKIPIYFWLVEKSTLTLDYHGISGFFNYRSQKLSEKYLAGFSSGVIVISSLLKDHYLKYLPEEKILVNPILVSIDTFKNILTPEFYKIKRELEIRINGKRLLVYGGSFGEKDGIYYLIDAFKKILIKYPDTLFVMTGKNKNPLIMNKVKAYVNKCNLQDKIQLVGFVNSLTLLCYNNMADILFVCRTNSPYANHGFPWKLGEYCMTSKPIIATRVGDLEKYFKDDIDLFLVAPNNSDEIAEKIVYVLDNFDKALIVAKNGKETALRSFGYIERTKEVADFIRNINKNP